MTGVSVEAKAARAVLVSLRDRIIAGSDRALENAASAAEKAARSTTSFKDRTHDLRDSIEHTPVFGHKATLRAMAPHARFVENGTPPHTITARRKPYLTFRINGAWVRVRSVSHPGTKARHFMRDAARAVEPILHANIERSTESAIRRHNR